MMVLPELSWLPPTASLGDNRTTEEKGWKERMSGDGVNKGALRVISWPWPWKLVLETKDKSREEIFWGTERKF